MPDYLLLTVSAILFVVAIYTGGRHYRGPAEKLLLLLPACLYLLITVLYFVSDYFTGKGFNESVLYHLLYGVSGAGFGDYTVIILSSVFFVVIGVWLTYYFIAARPRGTASQSERNSIALPLALIIAAIVLNPVSIYLAGSQFTEQKSDFDNYYHVPEVTGRPATRRNVVFIYAEGLERTYFDEAIFPGLIKKLRQLESRSTYFTGVSQVWKTGWTMGGMVASQCGIPLVTASHGNSMHSMDRFLEGAVCLGDLLHDEGYRLSFVGGASLKFGGKGKFFSTHGFTMLKGRKSLSRRLHDRKYMNYWGLHDDSLFDSAYREFEELSINDDPFGLFLLTLGTHPPRGSLSRSCDDIVYQDGSNPILNAVACSDHLIGDFVEKILASGHAENTLIVIASDHLSMRNTAYDKLEPAKRTNMLMILDPADMTAKEISRKGSMLDVGPTLMHSLGYRASIGLGRDLLGDDGTLSESLPDINASLAGWNNAILDFWRFPRIDTEIYINPADESITFNDREFRIPLLIEFNEKLETTMKFQGMLSNTHKNLIDYVGELGMNDPFMWVDYCKTLTSDSTATGVCVILGKLGARKISGFRAAVGSTISVNDLHRVILLKANEKSFTDNKRKYLNMDASG